LVEIAIVILNKFQQLWEIRFSYILQFLMFRFGFYRDPHFVGDRPPGANRIAMCPKPSFQTDGTDGNSHPVLMGTTSESFGAATIRLIVLTDGAFPIIAAKCLGLEGGVPQTMAAALVVCNSGSVCR
jgi:hypothetical protein